MKKKEPSTYHQDLPGVLLYEGDIDGLISILRTSENLTVSFEHGDIVYETLAELREHQGEVLRELKITVEDEARFTFSTSVSFSKSPMGDVVYLLFGRGNELPFRQATDFLKARRRWRLVNDSLFRFIQVCLYGLPFGYFLPQAVCRNLIFLKKRHEYVGFFSRNESPIVRAGFGIAGSIVGYVIRFLQETWSGF